GRDLVDAPGGVEAGDEDVAVREQLRVGRVRRGRAHREQEAAARVQPVDPAADLGYEGAAVRERRGPVRRGEGARRIVGAARRRAEGTDEPAAAIDADDAAV